MSARPDQIGSAPATARTRSTRFAVAAWGLSLVVTVIAGGAILHLAGGELREAHLYRQRTGEGLKFVWVGIGFCVATGFLGTATFAAVRLSSMSSRATVRRTLIASGALLVALTVAADVSLLWVGAHGDRCIGRCG